MSIRKIIGMDNGVSDFRIEVAPKLITLPKNIKSFALYLEKGMQVIGKFANDPEQAIKDSMYRFRNHGSAGFRISNIGAANYTWSIYSVHPETKEETYQDSAVFGLERTVKLYQMELAERQRDAQTSFKQKSIEKKEILQLWAQAKKKMQTRSKQKCVSATQAYQIQFQVQIRNVLDEEWQKMQQEVERSKVKRVKSNDDYTSISSQSRLKNTSDVKTKQPSAFEVQSAPYKLSSQLEEEINTRETIEEIPTYSIVNYSSREDTPVEPGVIPNEQDFNAVVKIVTPTGQQLDANEHQNRFHKVDNEDSSNGSRHPTKKFSLLSDIIQLSFEGSSSYGHPDMSSSNGFKTDPLRKDGTIDMVLEHDTQPQPLNKFKTLPYEHQKLLVHQEFRRAQTAERQHSDVQTSQIRESGVTGNDNEPAKETVVVSTGDPYGKWILISALVLMIIILLGGSLFDGTSRKKPKSKTKV